MQREAYYLNKRCIVRSSDNIWQCIIDQGSNIVCDKSESMLRNTIEWALNHCEDKIEYDGCFGDGDATRRIIEELYRLSGETNGTR